MLSLNPGRVKERRQYACRFFCCTSPRRYKNVYRRLPDIQSISEAPFSQFESDYTLFYFRALDFTESSSKTKAPPLLPVLSAWFGTFAAAQQTVWGQCECLFSHSFALLPDLYDLAND